jgi:opacity protein-like surface antigen
MKIMKKICAATLLCAVAVTPAMAKGFYAAADVGHTNHSNPCNGTSGCSNSSTVLRAGGGYQFTPRWATEVSFALYGKSNPGDTIDDWKTNGMQASGIGTFPVGESISVLGKLGVARITREAAGTTYTRTNLAYGIGAQYDFSKIVALRVQYERISSIGDDNTTGQSRLSMLSAGALYRF